MSSTIPLPVGIAELADLSPVDYDEAFTVTTNWSGSAEAWARHSMEGAPQWMRAVMINGWRTLGIRLAPLDSPGAVLGWPILHNAADALVIGVESTVGLTARIVIQTSPGSVVHAMVVRFETQAARVAWAAISPPHRVFVRRLLDVAAAE